MSNQTSTPNHALTNRNAVQGTGSIQQEARRISSTSVMAPTLTSVVNFLKSIGPGIIQSYRMYTPTECRNTAIYILGIMLYKLGYESFQGSVTSLATNRYDCLLYTSPSPRD